MSIRPRQWGTAVRLTAFLGVMLAVVLGLALLTLLRSFSAQTDATTTRSLVAELNAFAAGSSGRAGNQAFAPFAKQYLRTRTLPDGELLVVALPNGTLVGSTGSGPLLHTTVMREWAASPPPVGTRRHVQSDDTGYLLVAAPVVQGGRTIGTVIAAADVAQAHRDLGRVRMLALGEALIALLAGCAGTYLLLRRLLRRVVRITHTAADIGSGALDRRLRDTDGHDEVGQLATTFDAMADQLSAAMTSQRRLLSDVSHQLRTPLTVAKGHLEVLDRTSPTDPNEVHETIALVLDEIDHMKALVERLLMLGRAMEPDFLELEPVDLRSFCVDLLESAQVLADRVWVLDPVPDLVIDVDAAKLRGALLNLIDNAVRATQPGDVIALSVVEEPTELIAISVEDSGPGIPEERRAEVLQRFARPGAADSEGSGLGLAIARTVAEAHGGALLLETSERGGLAARLLLPAPRVDGLDGIGMPANEVAADEPEDTPQCVS